MADTHITVVSIVPAATPDIASTPITELSVGETPFAAVLGERLDALVAPQSPRDDAASTAPQEETDDPQSAAPTPLAVALPALAEARLWTTSAQSQATGGEPAAPALPTGKDIAVTRTTRAPTPISLAGAPDIEVPIAAVSTHAQGAAVAQPHLEPQAAALAQTPVQFVALPLASPAPAVPAAIVPIAPPVYAPEWRNAVSERIAVFVRERIHAAELHVNPPELGPVAVRIDVSGNEANIVFGVQHVETRNLLTEALPRLSEALAANGIALTGAHIGAELPAERQSGTAAADTDSAAPRTVESTVAARILRGLVDVFV